MFKTKDRKRTSNISILVVLLWLVVIFSLSSQVAEDSNQLSEEVTIVVAQAAEKTVPGTTVDVDHFHSIVRKNAHFFIYFVLGLLVVHVIRRMVRPRWKAYWITFSLCVLLACGDEVYQTSVPGRSGQVGDLLIDSLGVLTSLACYFCIEIGSNKFAIARKTCGDKGITDLKR
ncbi:VanZ family protein [Aquibacillus sediminis]|uniref:VanZ family protein n=1 Tax=Aquibacillus sediminis TaxID=2574734 RepID=UPI001109BD36|nr:VanZ family protein [Aquibacillus sediminis]